MSFVYAEKSQFTYENEIINSTVIYSETKTTLIGAYKSNWSPQASSAINKYGFIKCINVSPKFSVSFAGNNTGLAHDLLNWIYGKQKFTEMEVIDKAFEIHKSANKNDIEFILCYADDNNQTHIVCIKEGELYMDQSSAWIGSYNAFRKMQELRKSPNTSIGLFQQAVEECKDDSVGGFIICNSYFEREQRFLFPERFEAYTERTQTLQPGESIMLSGDAETGDYTIHFHESQNEVIIDFYQNNRSILYTNRYRYDQSDLDNTNTNRFLLPIIIETSTMKVL